MNRSMSNRCGVWDVLLAAMVLSGDSLMAVVASADQEDVHTKERTGATVPPLAVAPFDAAAAKAHQEAWAKHLGVPVEVGNSIGMKLVLVPPGEFMMGSSQEEIDRLLVTMIIGMKPGEFQVDLSREEIDRLLRELPSNLTRLLRPHLEVELPQHRVRITKPFYLGLYEVTQAQWERVMGNNPSQVNGAGHPIKRASWEDCQEFIQRLNGLPGERNGVYRLPTEAEWEYACLAGSRAAYSFGDSADSLGDYAWYRENSGERTHPVGQKKPNAWGLYDMHGNVWEWCSDWRDTAYYAHSPLDDPQGPESGSYRVCRGGGLSHDASYCRSARRFWLAPGSRHGDQGFRLAMTVSSPSR